jgi:hypothetical protein
MPHPPNIANFDLLTIAHFHNKRAFLELCNQLLLLVTEFLSALSNFPSTVGRWITVSHNALHFTNFRIRYWKPDVSVNGYPVVCDDVVGNDAA